MWVAIPSVAAAGGRGRGLFQPKTTNFNTIFFNFNMNQFKFQNPIFKRFFSSKCVNSAPRFVHIFHLCPLEYILPPIFPKKNSGAGAATEYHACYILSPLPETAAMSIWAWDTEVRNKATNEQIIQSKIFKTIM